MRLRRRALAAWLCAAAVGPAIASSTALADTFTLNLSVAPSGTVARALTVTASGNDPPDEGALYLEIDAIPTTVSPSCPTGYLNASQLAASSGGTLVAFDQPEGFDASGNFSNVNVFTPQTAGSFLLCGYTDDGAGDTLATTSMTTTIAAVPPAGSPPPPPPGGKPVNVAKPHVTRSGNTLSCKVGRWTSSPQKYSYRWLVAHKLKAGARKRSLRSAHKLRGHAVQCRVTASNSAGSATATSPVFRVH